MDTVFLLPLNLVQLPHAFPAQTLGVYTPSPSEWDAKVGSFWEGFLHALHVSVHHLSTLLGRTFTNISGSL